MKYDFTDKPSYLAWRAKWKADYAELSTLIRRAKRARKEVIRHYRYFDGEDGRSMRECIGKVPNPYANDWPEGFYLDDGRLQARFMLDSLAEAKALSWSMKQALRVEAA